MTLISLHLFSLWKSRWHYSWITASYRNIFWLEFWKCSSLGVRYHTLSFLRWRNTASCKSVSAWCLKRKTFAASDSHPCISQHFSDLPSQQQSQMGLHSEVFCWASVVAYSKQGTARISRLIKALGVYFWFLFSETSFRCSQRSGLPRFSLQPLFCITVVTEGIFTKEASTIICGF